ncbi:predicted protein [Escherichia coli DH1]|jgi:hypothetical protein|uniref:Uncharacterized protein YbbV n=2 Tax=Escherichia coli TaxID=562 RepID=YBBV_ECOLI|nr:RecName: Full=Uncharacterized protein YbbV [Escherichia coli K-12]ACB01635.1 predicted protein [Escherichia coli str. K-12 substr. DH10B]APK54465.1 hypothetical protein RG45_18145 [Escherichia coli]CCK45659.1 hypothetical protein BN16_09741 [Escherichia coli chi7122]BAE76288.1 hypothetical protein [Escherichia coli str. K-12 substr. W3110]BAJ42350.1 predicted protein [Escherichia coli DH1]BAL37710.1 predicted protein [Escherichia coli str. K-12 substr. MDS42]
MNRPAILKKKAAKDVASVLKIIFLFYLFLIARLKQRYSIREIKRDLWNIRENYSSNAAIAKIYCRKRKASGPGKHLTILPYGWVRFITFPIM